MGLSGIQRHLAAHGSTRLMKLERKIQQELDMILNQEELLCFQRSQEDWIKSGDKNTKFYHASTLVRKNKNMVESLKDNNGIWVHDPTVLENMVQYFYRKLFQEEGSDTIGSPIPNDFPNVPEAGLQLLKKPFAKQEIKKPFLT